MSFQRGAVPFGGGEEGKRRKRRGRGGLLASARRKGGSVPLCMGGLRGLGGMRLATASHGGQCLCAEEGKASGASEGDGAICKRAWEEGGITRAGAAARRGGTSACEG